MQTRKELSEDFLLNTHRQKRQYLQSLPLKHKLTR